jgi:hypothetical protein
MARLERQALHRHRNHLHRSQPGTALPPLPERTGLMNTTLDLEWKYRIEVAGAVVMLPFTLAKKNTTYPESCIFDHDEPMPAIDRTHLCWLCTEWLRESLATISEHWPDLEDALAPAGGRAASSERVSGTGDLYPPLPINGEVSDIMRKARNTVWSTIGQLVQDRPDLRMPADHGTGVLADWLARWHVQYLASHPSPGHLMSVGKELAKIVPAIKSAAYQSPPVEVPLDGNCHQTATHADGRTVPCPGQVVAWQQGDGEKVVRCSVDATHRVSADQWFRTHAYRAPRQARAMNTLKKKYLKERQP